MLEYDEIARILVSSAGVAVMLYGIWCAGLDRAVKSALQRANQASERFILATEQLETCKIECIKLEAKVKFLEGKNEENNS